MSIAFYRITKSKGYKSNTTISNYGIKYVFEKLTNSLLNNELNRSMYWMSEMFCSGYIDQLWQYSFEFYSMYVHIYYPNLIVYIYDKFKEYKHLKRTSRAIELRNNINLRDYFYRIFYIFSTINKRFIVDLFQHQELFKPFRVMFVKYKHLDPTNIEILKRLSEKDADEIISFMNNKSRDQIENALDQLRVSFDHFIKSYKNTSDQTRFLIYNWLSFLLEKGAERFDLYHKDSYIHLKHCRNENKYSYFIWIIWNIILEHSEKLEHIKKEVQILYTLYEGLENNQCINAYYFIICAFMIVLEKVIEKRIFIDEPKYRKGKKHFYNCFGFIEESLQNKDERRDLI